MISLDQPNVDVVDSDIPMYYDANPYPQELQGFPVVSQVPPMQQISPIPSDLTSSHQISSPMTTFESLDVPKQQKTLAQTVPKHKRFRRLDSVKYKFLSPEGHDHYDNRNNIKLSNFGGVIIPTAVGLEQEKHVTGINAISKAGKDVMGNTKECQDTYFVLRDINGMKEFNAFAVLDGHGKYGRPASHFIRDFIQTSVTSNQQIAMCKTHEELYHCLKNNNFQIIRDIYFSAEKNLESSGIDCSLSGSTCVIVFQIGSHLICSNCGDSRAVLVCSEPYGSSGAERVLVYNLSEDHKPSLPNEKARIESMGGEVHKINGLGPDRVYVKGQNLPGLAMSRSIGDIIATKVGVLPLPDFKEYSLDEKCKFLMICCDGIWDFVDYNTVMNLGNKYYKANNPQQLCSEMVNNAVKLWRQEGSYVDDITVVTVFFN